mgnify:FL=1
MSRDCKDCAFCNLKKLNCGKWYCMNPDVSVFNLPVPEDKPCFTPRKGSVRNNNVKVD